MAMGHAKVNHIQRSYHTIPPPNQTYLATHQAHNTDATVGTGRFYLGGENGALGLIHGRLESKRLVNDEDIVIDRFGYRHDGTKYVLPHAFFVDGLRSRISPVTPQHEEHVDHPEVETLHNLVDLGVTPTCAEDGTTL